jgi:hypothetical protein
MNDVRLDFGNTGDGELLYLDTRIGIVLKLTNLCSQESKFLLRGGLVGYFSKGTGDLM